MWHIVAARVFTKEDETISKKNAANLAALKEGYKTLNSEEEVCISRVAAILTIKLNKGNVAYCRIAYFYKRS